MMSTPAADPKLLATIQCVIENAAATGVGAGAGAGAGAGTREDVAQQAPLLAQEYTASALAENFCRRMTNLMTTLCHNYGASAPELQASLQLFTAYCMMPNGKTKAIELWHHNMTHYEDGRVRPVSLYTALCSGDLATVLQSDALQSMLPVAKLQALIGDNSADMDVIRQHIMRMNYRAILYAAMPSGAYDAMAATLVSADGAADDGSDDAPVTAEALEHTTRHMVETMLGPALGADTTHMVMSAALSMQRNFTASDGSIDMGAITTMLSNVRAAMPALASMSGLATSADVDKIARTIEENVQQVQAATTK